ncbi:MAG TPA: VOC family protein [Hyphomicrobiales bacterium]|nr:VOC family protein [Hyphomicrobiales bacterium]
MLQKLHHVAYRCTSAAETVDFYTKGIGLKFAHALTNDYVPSVKSYDPHIHIFFEMADGSYIAFFEVPQSPPAQPDAGTPSWVQHLALEVKDLAALNEGKRRLVERGVDVIGPVDHGFCQSIYFHDPSGHRLEMTVRTEQPGELQDFEAAAFKVLAKWQERARAEGWPSAKTEVPAA